MQLDFSGCSQEWRVQVALFKALEHLTILPREEKRH